MRNRLPAYTILEVIIAMLITAVLIGIIYSAFTIVNRAYLSFDKKQGGLSSLLQVDRLLKRDFSASAIVWQTGHGIAMSNDSAAVSYTLLPGQIIRTAQITDTFKVQMAFYRVSFENQPLNGIDTDTARRKLDDLELKLYFGTDTIPFHYHKYYSSADLFQ